MQRFLKLTLLVLILVGCEHNRYQPIAPKDQNTSNINHNQNTQSPMLQIQNDFNDNLKDINNSANSDLEITTIMKVQENDQPQYQLFLKSNDTNLLITIAFIEEGVPIKYTAAISTRKLSNLKNNVSISDDQINFDKQLHIITKLNHHIWNQHDKRTIDKINNQLIEKVTITQDSNEDITFNYDTISINYKPKSSVLVVSTISE